ncbi:MAG: two-component system response regulator, partial [Desulfobacterales bacterium]|nr:two-component system response regulator [Desulfobacterales bacterium]
KWDGSGYPRGLKGEAIPLSARIVSLADVYDALTTRRFYKEAYSHDKAKNMIIELKGKHFDPEIVNAFFAVQDTFNRVRAEKLKQEAVLIQQPVQALGR